MRLRLIAHRTVETRVPCMSGITTTKCAQHSSKRCTAASTVGTVQQKFDLLPLVHGSRATSYDNSMSKPADPSHAQEEKHQQPRPRPSVALQHHWAPTHPPWQSSHIPETPKRCHRSAVTPTVHFHNSDCQDHISDHRQDIACSTSSRKTSAKCYRCLIQSTEGWGFRIGPLPKNGNTDPSFFSIACNGCVYRW